MVLPEGARTDTNFFNAKTHIHRAKKSKTGSVTEVGLVK
jgi:hypothetical protein